MTQLKKKLIPFFSQNYFYIDPPPNIGLRWTNLKREKKCVSFFPYVFSLTPISAKHPLTDVVETSGQMEYSKYWPAMTQFPTKKMHPFFNKIIWLIPHTPFARVGGVSRGRSVAVAVGCWLLAVGTSLALQRHFLGTSTTQKNTPTKKWCLGFFANGATIPIGQEIQCLQ